MKVLTRGDEVEHTIYCGLCNSELAITTRDIIQDNPQDVYSTKGHVVCPVCGHVIKTYNGQFKKRQIVWDEDTKTNRKPN